jgi:hypothetical protein
LWVSKCENEEVSDPCCWEKGWFGAGECPPHRELSLFRAFNNGQWRDNMQIFDNNGKKIQGTKSSMQADKIA